ncbi:MAG: Fic family protein, partial [Candidatus Thermoplasmatota archaeon]
MTPEAVDATPKPPRLLRPIGAEKLVEELKPLIEQIELARVRIDEISPPFSAEQMEIQPGQDAYHIFHSNAIEGNVLTSLETEEIVVRGATVSGRPIKDVLEANNLKGAMKTVSTMLQNKAPFDERALLSLHDMVMRDNQEGIEPGQFRRGNVHIAGNAIEPPDPILLPDYLAEFWDWLDGDSKALHPVLRASIAHWWFVRIHPFRDGNGRIGRLLFYFLLSREGYRLAPVIVKEERQKYYACLAAADNNDFRPICEFLCQAILRALRDLERQLAAQKLARESLSQSLGTIRSGLERQQQQTYDLWRAGMEGIQRDFAAAAKHVA